MTIALTGFMGCGKSSVGRELAGLLSLPFVDLDESIVSKAGMSIPEIFERMGEGEFRRLERECLGEVLASGSDTVLSLGGGTVLDASNALMLSTGARCVYLKADPSTILEHLGGKASGRPLLQGGSSLEGRVKELMEQRSHVYESVAQITIEVDGRNQFEVSRIISEFLRYESGATDVR